MDRVAPLTGDLAERATDTLARAFASDPLFAWIFPEPTSRLEALRRFQRVPLVYALRYGRVTQSHEGQAVAVWLPPGQPIHAIGMVRSGVLAVPFHVGFRAFARLMRANDVMASIHAGAAPEPHWYLLGIGVRPALQGRGRGTALLREGLARADEAGRACYLETSEERNLVLYERHGFVVVGQASLGEGGPLAWALRREPRPDSSTHRSTATSTTSGAPARNAHPPVPPPSEGPCRVRAAATTASSREPTIAAGKAPFESWGRRASADLGCAST